MADKTRGDEPPSEALETLADRINSLIDRAQPAGRGPLSNAEVAALIEKATGEKFSHTTIWKLRNGQAANPQMRLIGALSHTFGVPPGFFFAEFADDQQASLLQEQSELLALVRSADVTCPQLRAILRLSPQARQAITDLIEHISRLPGESSGRKR
jgi:ESX-1-secreted protein regulator